MSRHNNTPRHSAHLYPFSSEMLSGFEIQGFHDSVWYVEKLGGTIMKRLEDGLLQNRSVVKSAIKPWPLLDTFLASYSKTSLMLQLPSSSSLWHSV